MSKSGPMTSMDRLSIGIWLEWAAGVKLTGEGVWTLFCQVLRHMPAQHVRIVLLCPEWLGKAAHELRATMRPEMAAVTTIVVEDVGRMALRRRAARGWRKAQGNWLASRAPFRWLVGFLAGGFSRVRQNRRSRRAEMKASYADYIFEAIARKASAMTDIDVWLVPFSGFVQSARLKAPKVCILHDFLYDEYPEHFDPHLVQEGRAAFRTVINAADCCITLSEYVRTKHGIEALGANPNRIFAVPLAPMDRRDILPFIPRDHTKTPASRAAAADMIRRYCATMRAPNRLYDALSLPYLRDFPFEDVDIILLSTQNRPHKQIKMVVEALELLIRREYRPIKLIMTGLFDLGDPVDEVGAYVSEHGLFFDVLCLPRLPIDVHTALYHVAALTIHPSPFEASFPFTFGESISVGTPVVLARSAVVAAELDGTAYTDLTYGSQSLPALVDRIRWALDFPETALALGTALFKERSRRTWSDVAADYLALLEATANSRAHAARASGPSQ